MSATGTAIANSKHALPRFVSNRSAEKRLGSRKIVVAAAVMPSIAVEMARNAR